MIASKKTESLLKILAQNKVQDQTTSEFYQLFKELIPILLKLLKNYKRKEWYPKAAELSAKTAPLPEFSTMGENESV